MAYKFLGGPAEDSIIGQQYQPIDTRLSEN